jgi:hypothetical protein
MNQNNIGSCGDLKNLRKILRKITRQFDVNTAIHCFFTVIQSLEQTKFFFIVLIVITETSKILQAIFK